MVNIRVVVFLIFFMNIFINGQQLEKKCQTDIPNDKYDCFDRIDEEQKEDFHCCFRTNYASDGTQSYQCDLVGKEDFEDIEGYKEDEIAGTSYEKIDVDCYQSHLNINKTNKNSYFLLFIFNLLLMII